MSQNQPHNVEAEMSVLGAVMLENESFHKLDLKADDFFVTKHHWIFTAMVDLVSVGDGIDLVTVVHKLTENGTVQKCGGASYLATLLDYVTTAANISYYANIVNTQSKLRQVIAAAQSILHDAGKQPDPDVLISNALGQLQSVGQSQGKIWSGLKDQFSEYQKYINSAGEVSFFTGFPNLDGIINNGRGVAPGEVMTIVGYSGTFKSAFLQNVLLNSCMKTGRISLFFSMEMPTTLVCQRTIQIALEQSTYYIESGAAGKKPGYSEDTLRELQRIGADKLIVSPRSALTIEQVEHYTRIARAEYGNIGVVAIDYLGLMDAEGAKSEYERISYCAEQAKNMAKRLNLPVVILTQINRSSAAEGELETWSAKGSGAIEASADYMVGIQRNKQKEIIIKMMKNRNGEANLSFLADLDAKYLKFRGLEPYDAISQKNVTRGIDRLNAMKNEPVPMTDPFY